MIKHIVMWKFKENVESKSKAENSAMIKILLENLKGKIEQIQMLEVGININTSQSAYDAVLYSHFSNLEDLAIYQKHPEHLKVAEYIHKIMEERAVVDYEVI